MTHMCLKSCIALLALVVVCHPSRVASQTCGGGGKSDALPPMRHVTTLTEYSLSGTVNDGRIHFVLFYVPSCRNCLRVLPQFQQLADNLHGKYPEIALGRLDCDPEGDFCEGQGLTGVPRGIVYYQGKKQLMYQPAYWHIELFQPFIIKYAHTLRDMTASIAAPKPE